MAALTKLKALNLSNTGVTSEALPFFKGLRHLQSLAMYGCNNIQASDEIEDLQRDLPNLKCMRLSGSFDREGTIGDGESEESNENRSTVDDEDISFADESDRESNFSFFVEDQDEEEEENVEAHRDDDDDEVMEDEFEE